MISLPWLGFFPGIEPCGLNTLHVDRVIRFAPQLRKTIPLRHAPTTRRRSLEGHARRLGK